MQHVLKGEFVLKDVRFWFYKDGSARFISHLDLYRCMLKAVKRAKLPIWHTEGFNSHPFMTINLPLPLGVRGMAESFDIRLYEDEEINTAINSEEIQTIKQKIFNEGKIVNKIGLIEEINKYLPYKIGVTDILYPIMKPSLIQFALFEIKICDNILDNDKIVNCLLSFINRENIIVIKKTKSGGMEIDLKEYIKNYLINEVNGKICIDIILPAGNQININPFLFTNAFREYCNSDIYCDITRIKLFDGNMNKFL